MAIVHRTYTQFDIRAVTIQGLSAKPDAEQRPAIGKFGTGLKYAIAVLVREGCSVTIVTPEGRYKIVGKASEFRGQHYEGLMLRHTYQKDGKQRIKRSELPFTTHYGSNWELWMAFRELHSNTLDEGGWTRQFHDVPGEHQHVSEGCAIIVEGEPYEREFYKSHQTFLPQDPGEIILSTPAVDIYELPHPNYVSEVKYYRGVRAGALRCDGSGELFKFIYNVKSECYLSEERQVNDHYWDWAVAQAIAECEDKDIIKEFLEADEDFFEHHVAFNPAMRFSEAFMAAAGYAKVPSRVYEMIEKKKPKSIEQLAIEEFPTPWRVNDYSVVADNGNMVATKPAGMSAVDFVALWADRVVAINEHAPSASFHGRGASDEADAAPVVAEQPLQEADDLPEEADVPY